MNEQTAYAYGMRITLYENAENRQFYDLQTVEELKIGLNQKNERHGNRKPNKKRVFSSFFSS